MVKGSGKRWKAIVMVADDDPLYVELVRVNMHASGYRVSTAPDEATAIGLVETQNPDLVILDVIMPDIDGYQVCRRIREFSLIPIVMLTARGEQYHKVKGLQWGADEYVTKPFAVAELLTRVDAVLRHVNRPKRGRPA